jgi:hypothetical protein
MIASRKELPHTQLLQGDFFLTSRFEPDALSLNLNREIDKKGLAIWRNSNHESQEKKDQNPERPQKIETLYNEEDNKYLRL